jgi:hypothetical protein
VLNVIERAIDAGVNCVKAVCRDGRFVLAEFAGLAQQGDVFHRLTNMVLIKISLSICCVKLFEMTFLLNVASVFGVPELRRSSLVELLVSLPLLQYLAASLL